MAKILQSFHLPLPSNKEARVGQKAQALNKSGWSYQDKENNWCMIDNTEGLKRSQSLSDDRTSDKNATSSKGLKRSQSLLGRRKSWTQNKKNIEKDGKLQRAHKQPEPSPEKDLCARTEVTGKLLAKHEILDINDGLLPNQTELDTIVKENGRCSEEVSVICAKICSSLRSRIKNIIDVWPAYRCAGDNKDTVYFVVTVKEDIGLGYGNANGYNIVWRTSEQVNDEGKEVIYSDMFEKCLTELSYKEIERLKSIIDQINVCLMQNHSNLTLISASPVRSKGYGKKHEILKECCIVLYVLVKEFVPLREEPFQTEYEGIHVDVREGMFKCFGAQDYQYTLLQGCQIQRYRSGTLGGFINHPEFGTCGITCAHVLLNLDEFKKFYSDKTVQDWPVLHSDTEVYQPIRRAENVFGHLVRAIYREGGGGESGLDIAVFQIEKRYPDSGNFPLLKDGKSSDMRFDTGKTAGVTRLRSRSSVVKFGKTSEKTQGNVTFNVPMTSAKTIKLYENYPTVKYHNLLEAKTVSFSGESQNSPFASFGDSGALVFCKGEAEQLFCVGMVVGGTSANTCLIMPIAPILQQLQIQGLKTFEIKKINDEHDELTKKMDDLNQRVETGFEGVQRNFDILFASQNISRP